MDIKQTKQEGQYSFPYHHIPSLKKGRFSQTRTLLWGYAYISYLETVLDYVEKVLAASLLDIGCGDGKFLYEARKRFPDMALSGNDYSERAIAFAKAFNFGNNVYLSTRTAKEISREKGLFDVVTAIEVLEHIPPQEIDSFSKSFAAALSPDGIGIITVPSDNQPVNQKHYQHFNKHTLREALSPHLTITEIFFLNDSSWKNWVIQRALSNRFFILNDQKVATALYNYYRKNLLKSTPERCERLMAIVQKN